MVTMEQFLVVALVVLLTVIVACGVVALILLKRAVDDEKQARDSASEHRITSLESDTPTETDVMQTKARYEESLRQMARAQFSASEQIRDAEEAIAEARRDAEAAATDIAYRVRMAEEAHAEAVAQANKLVFETVAKYDESSNWHHFYPETGEPEPRLTQEDLDRLLYESRYDQQSA
jgi:septal ring factor EnvC (AmiA/AmiB activator)